MTESQARKKAALREGLVVAKVVRDKRDRLVIEGLGQFERGRGYRVVEGGSVGTVALGDYVVLEPI